MTTPQFKPGDKVRRLPEWQNLGGWRLGDTVVEVVAAGEVVLNIQESPDCWDLTSFEFAEPRPQPYAIQAKDFDPTRHEWTHPVDEGKFNSWSRPPYRDNSWLVVRDKPAPPPKPVTLELRIVGILDDPINRGATSTFTEARQIAIALIAEGYATEYPNQQAS